MVPNGTCLHTTNNSPMKLLAHISDLHFGREIPAVAEGLLADLNAIQPQLIVVSGDLTQRARRNQYRAAAAYLSRLPATYMVVPGNHDIPLYNVFARFLSPLGYYKKYITTGLRPIYNDEEIAVLGINTARSLTWKGGRISEEQIDDMKKKLCALPANLFKIVVTHHPFIPPPDGEGIDLVGRSIQALDVIDECNVDLLLAGHLHHAYTDDVRSYYKSRSGSVVVAQAGTAISNRLRRGMANSYNLITLHRSHIEVAERRWNGTQFYKAAAVGYTADNNDWHREDLGIEEND